LTAGAASLAASATATAPGANGPIAFARDATARDDPNTAQIFARDPDGSERQLTHFSGGAVRPAWSPDGSRIAFERWFPPNHPDEIYVMNADGSGLKALLMKGCRAIPHCLSDDQPTYSPDGKRIVFQRVYKPFDRHR